MLIFYSHFMTKPKIFLKRQKIPRIFASRRKKHPFFSLFVRQMSKVFFHCFPSFPVTSNNCGQLLTKNKLKFLFFVVK